MPFQVIPALDVADGRLARIGHGAPVAVDAFHGDPVAAARTFLDAGATWLHVVDVRRALAGGRRDLAVLRSVASTGAHVQASGGIGSRAEAEEALEAGAERVVLGAHSLGDRTELERTVVALGPSVVVGIEVRRGVIHPRAGGLDLPLEETLGWLSELPVRRVLCTAVARVGRLEGPDVGVIARVAREGGWGVVAAGGIRDLDDLRRVAGSSPRVEGAVIGRALYEGLDLHLALRAVAEL